MADIHYAAPPTCAAFMKSEAFFRLIAGPVGSGKTTACLFELLRRSCEQDPAPDGFRYTRFAIVRQTLSQLKMTVLKDITLWLKGIAEWKVSENTIHIRIGDVISEWVLVPLEDPEDRKRLLSSQLTGAWISECIEIDVELVADISGRCARFPSGMHGGCTWAGVIADTNMPPEGTPWHTNMAVNVPPDWQVFIQPGGLTDQAENLEWLNQSKDTLTLALTDPRRRAQGRIYYERLARNNTPDWVKRYVHAQFGDDPSGTAVFKDTFRRAFHVAQSLTPVVGHPLIVGQDFGRDPASIICQVDHKGRLLVLEEVYAEDTGLELQLQKLRPVLLQERYMGRPVVIVGDPAGRAKDSIYEETSFDVIKRMGFKAYPAPTNDIDPRIRSVESFLLQQRDGGAAMVIDGSRCPTLVRALDGGYRYGKTKAGQRKPNPDKNKYSHISDALQYVCLAAHGGMTNMLAAQLRRPTASRPSVSAAAWT